MGDLNAYVDEIASVLLHNHAIIIKVHPFEALDQVIEATRDKLLIYLDRKTIIWDEYVHAMSKVYSDENKAMLMGSHRNPSVVVHIQVNLCNKSILIFET